MKLFRDEVQQAQAAQWLGTVTSHLDIANEQRVTQAGAVAADTHHRGAPPARDNCRGAAGGGLAAGAGARGGAGVKGCERQSLCAQFAT
jgi:hypothetical protein